MLINIGRIYVDPRDVSAVTVQEHDGDKVILIFLSGAHHPILHDKFEGTEEEEAMRVGMLLNQSLLDDRDQMIATEQRFQESGSRSFENGEVVVRISEDELNSRIETAHAAGWNEHSRQVNLKTVQLSTTGVLLTTGLMAEAAKQVSSDEHMVAYIEESLRASYEAVAAAMGGKIEWQA